MHARWTSSIIRSVSRGSKTQTEKSISPKNNRLTGCTDRQFGRTSSTDRSISLKTRAALISVSVWIVGLDRALGLSFVPRERERGGPAGWESESRPPEPATLHSLALRHLPVSIKSSSAIGSVSSGPRAPLQLPKRGPLPLLAGRVSTPIKGHRAFRLLPNLRLVGNWASYLLAFIGYGFLWFSWVALSLSLSLSRGDIDCLALGNSCLEVILLIPRWPRSKLLREKLLERCVNRCDSMFTLVDRFTGLPIDFILLRALFSQFWFLLNGPNDGL